MFKNATRIIIVIGALWFVMGCDESGNVRGVDGSRHALVSAMHRQPPSFEALDKNNDGFLTMDELARPENKIQKLDTDNDGSISKAEFDAWVASRRTEMKERMNGRFEGREGRPSGDVAENAERGQHRPAPSFEALDKNGDGKLTADELVRPENRIGRIDTDGDQKISKAEFDAWIAEHAAKGKGCDHRKHERRPLSDKIPG